MAKIPNETAKISLSDIPEIEDKLATMLEKKWDDGLAMHQQRIVGFQFFARVAHNMSLFDKIHDDSFSEGSTQTIKRKIRAQTIQRVPDGEIVTPYDKNTVQQAVIDYLFKHKILQSEFDGKDMLKQLWKTFNLSYDYGFGCVRTGFEEDLDGDPRITYTLINYNDIIPSPDCKCIEEADWYIVREYVPMSTLKSLIDCETDTLLDPTYDGDVVRLLIPDRSRSQTGRRACSRRIPSRSGPSTSAARTSSSRGFRPSTASSAGSRTTIPARTCPSISSFWSRMPSFRTDARPSCGRSRSSSMRTHSKAQHTRRCCSH